MLARLDIIMYFFMCWLSHCSSLLSRETFVMERDDILLSEISECLISNFPNIITSVYRISFDLKCFVFFIEV